MNTWWIYHNCWKVSLIRVSLHIGFGGIAASVDLFHIDVFYVGSCIFYVLTVGTCIHLTLLTLNLKN